MYSKESLERLKGQVNLVDVLSSHITLKRTGAVYKGLCPFHEEKSPSFIVRSGDSHYHCFGCGAHGDAIAFLMNFLKFSFAEAIEKLSEMFAVRMEKVAKEEPSGPSKQLLRSVMDAACRFYHFFLLHTDEGHQALRYLFQRGIDLDFIQRFKVGLAPKRTSFLTAALKQKGFEEKLLYETGLIKEGGREFFSDRISFPILDPLGHVIGFSARKYKEETFGPKYINSPETPLFKKSEVLYGLSFCRKRIAKERRAIIVEGQIDALRLIQEGIDLAIAAQGTAFGEEHAKILMQLGVHQVYLALDGDGAGTEAAIKIGHLFQKEGVEVLVMAIESGEDPDSLLRKKGPEFFLNELEKSADYLTYLYQTLLSQVNSHSPAAKNEVVQIIAKKIRSWDHPLMIHESLRKLAQLANVPENLIQSKAEMAPPVYIKNVGTLTAMDIDPNRILETDLLRWFFLPKIPLDKLSAVARLNLSEEDLFVPACRKIYTLLLSQFEEKNSIELLAICSNLDDVEQRIFLSEILQKKVDENKAFEGFIETVKKIKERNWMEKREELRLKIHKGGSEEEDLLDLAKQFDALKRKQPQVILPE